MRTVPEERIDAFNRLATELGAQGRFVYVQFPETIVLTYPRTVYPVRGGEADRFLLYQEIERDLRASAVTNPLLKYMIRKGLSYRDVGRILSRSHVRVIALCRGNPSMETRRYIQSRIPEVAVEAWPEEPRR